MNCQEALSLLYDIIDKEASDIDAQQVAEHLRHCEDCAGKYKLEQAVHQLIQAKLQNQESGTDVEVIKAKVLAQMDDVDRINQPEPNREPRRVEPPPPKQGTPPSFRLGRALAIAASVVVVVTAGYFGLRAFDDHAFYVPLEQAHLNVAGSVEEYDSPAKTTLARAETMDRLYYDVSPNVNGFDLIGGHMEKIDGLDVAHFVYRNGDSDNLVSVFVIDANLMTLPDDLVNTVVTHNGVDFYDHNCRGCRLVYHRAGNALVVTATTQWSLELLDFVPDREPVPNPTV